MLTFNTLSITGPHRLPSRRPASPSWRHIAGCVLLAAGLLPLQGGAFAQQPAAEPQLPAQIRDQLEIDRLKRQIEIIRLQQELRELQGLQDSEFERKVKQLGDMRLLLEVNSEVRDLLQGSPELDAQYRRILNIDTPPPACGCLDTAQVNQISAGEQAGGAVIYLNGAHHDLQIGDRVGDSACILQEADAGTNSATLTCAGSSRTLTLFNIADPSNR